jgi:hypothetical protein
MSCKGLQGGQGGQLFDLLLMFFTARLIMPAGAPALLIHARNARIIAQYFFFIAFYNDWSLVGRGWALWRGMAGEAGGIRGDLFNDDLPTRLAPTSHWCGEVRAASAIHKIHKIHKIRNTEYGIRNSEFGIRNTPYALRVHFL